MTAEYRCNYCGGNDFHCPVAGIYDWEYGVTGRYDYRQCLACDGVQLHPFPGLDDLRRRVADQRVVDLVAGRSGDVGLPAGVVVDAVDTDADDLAVAGAKSSFMPATVPSSVVQTGVKSLGWLNSKAQPSPIQSWNEISPSVVWAVKSGAVSLSRRAMAAP